MIDDISLLIDKGYTPGQVARELKCSRTTIRNKMAKHGLKTEYQKKLSHMRDSSDDIWERFDGGETIQSIANGYGVKNDTLTKYMDSIGKPLKKCQYKPFDFEVYRRLRLDRKSNTEISKIFGISESHLYNRLSEYDYSPRIINKPDKSTLSDLYERYPCTYISNLYNVDKKTVLRWMEDYNLDRDARHTNISTPHRMVLEFLDSLGVEYTINDRSICKFESDILIESHKLAIEVNGLYWHSVLQKERDYHYKKKIAFNDNGYDLIYIREDQIYDNVKFNIFKTIIRKKIDISGAKRYFARKLTKVELDYSYANDILLHNHILGGCKFTKCIALVDSNSDVKSLITYVDTPNGRNLNRYCVVGMNLVVGGYERLISGIGQHYTFSDLDYVQIYNNVYINSGYEAIGKVSIDYGYTNKTEYKHKFNFRKDRLKCKYGIDIEGKTEHTIAAELGWYKYYTSGKQKYAR